MRPHRRQPTRHHRPWDFPGKNTGVGCHFLLQCMKVKSESEVIQSCLTLHDTMDCSLPGSSVHGIFQAKVLEWVAIAFSDYTIYFRLILTIIIKYSNIVLISFHFFPTSFLISISWLLFSRSVMSDSLGPYGLQPTMLPCPSLSPTVCSNSCPLSQQYHQTISFSIAPFSTCPQSFSASGSFPMSQFFVLGG